MGLSVWGFRASDLSLKLGGLAFKVWDYCTTVAFLKIRVCFGWGRPYTSVAIIAVTRINSMLLAIDDH